MFQHRRQSAQSAPSVSLQGERFDFIRERRDGVRVYRGTEGFLRVGDELRLSLETNLQRTLEGAGCPVPRVLKTGTLPNGERFFLEKALPAETFGSTFTREFRANARVSDESFESMTHMMKVWTEGQIRTTSGCVGDPQSILDHQRYGEALGCSTLDASRLRIVTNRLRNEVAIMPAVVTHFDLGTFNALPGGAIDFETVRGVGPLGYDQLSLVTGFFWSPPGLHSSTPGARPFEFTREQIGHYLRELTPVLASAGVDLNNPSTVTAFLLLRSGFRLVRSPDFPAVVAWRRAICDALLDAYDRGGDGIQRLSFLSSAWN